ncbi:MAG: DUF3971 domain-containing protein [Alphaproteobacteria bacterium]|nr:DUF3971 domain-containing protein [Alphaproteobacteria bacterium]
MIIRASKHFFCYLGLLGLIAIIVVSAAVYRLQKAPISLDFLTTTLEEEIEEELGGRFDVVIDETIISWRDVRKPPQFHAVGFKLMSISEAADAKADVGAEIKAEDVKSEDVKVENVKDNLQQPSNKDVLLSIPEVTVSFSLRGLLAAKLRPSKIRFHSPEISLLRKADGALHYGVGKDEAHISLVGASADNNFADVIRKHLTPLGTDGFFKYLKSMEILHVGFKMQDEKQDFTWETPDVSIEIQRTKDDVNIFTIVPLQAKDGASKSSQKDKRLKLITNYNISDKVARVSVFIKNFLPADIKSYFPENSQISNTIKLVNSSIRGEIVMITDLNSSSLTVDNVKKVMWDINAYGGSIEAPAGLDAVYPLQKARIKGELKTGFGDVNVEAFDIVFSNLARISGSAHTEGLMAFVNKDNNAGHSSVFSAVINANLDNLPVNDLADYWPKSLAPAVRKWMTTNMLEGKYDGGSFAFHIKENMKTGAGVVLEKLEGDLLLDGVTVAYTKGIPVVKGVGGKAHFTADNITVDIEKGKSEKLDVVDAHLDFRGFREKVQYADMNIHVKGQLPDALRYVDNDPLNYGDKIRFKPEQTKGLADVKVFLSFPMAEWFDPAQHMTSKVDAVLSDVVIKDVAFGRALKKGALKLNANNKAVTLSGKAMVSGFDPYIVGDVPIAFKYFEGSDKKGREFLDINLDMTNNDLAVPIFDWKKIKGEKASAVAKIYMHNGRIASLPEITIKSKDASVIGNIKNEGQKTVIDFDKVEFALNNAKVKAVLSDAEISLDIEGKSFDISNIPSVLFSRTRDGKDVDDNGKDHEKDSSSSMSARVNEILNGRGHVRVNANLDRIFVSDWGYINQFSMALNKDEYGWKTGNMQGKIGDGNAPISMNFKEKNNVYSNENRRLALTVLSSDAGSFLKAFGITNHVKYGALEIRGIADGYFKELEGLFRIHQYRLIKAPTLAKIFSIASFTGILDMLSGEGIAFDKIKIPFKKKDNRIYFEDAKTSGVTVGLTGKGYFDMAEGIIDMRGIAVPAYMFNSLLGKIPVLGGVFIGEEGGGLFAVTFKVRGKTSNPDVKVNPLSAFAPGVLRNLFNGGTEKNGHDDLDIQSAP